MRKWMGLLLLLILFAPLYGAFESIGGTARSKALGEAMFGEMDGVNSVSYNPATISLLREIQVYGAWDTAFAGFDDGSGINAINVDIVLPFWNSISAEPYVTRRAAVGISVHRNSLSYNDGSGSSTEIYHEGIYSFTYAKDLNDVISRGAKISAGVRFNIFDIGFSESGMASNPLLSGDLQKLGFGLDVGVTYDFSESIRLGLSMKNLISPNMAILEGGSNSQVSELRFGANWKIGDILFMKDSRLGGGIVSYGRDPSDNRAADTSYNLGFQFGFVQAENLKNKPFNGELFQFRLGAIYQSKKTQADIFNLTTGLGFQYVFARKHKLMLDYALEYGFSSGILQHTAGLTYAFILPNSAFVYDKQEYNDLVKEELKAAGQLKEEQPYVPQFPTNLIRYDNALIEADNTLRTVKKLRAQLTNYKVLLGEVIDMSDVTSTNNEQIFKEFRYKVRQKGVTLRVVMNVGATVTYEIETVPSRNLPEDMKKAVEHFSGIVLKMPDLLTELRDGISRSQALQQELAELQKTAPKDFVKKDRKYLKKALQDLKLAEANMEPMPEEIKALVQDYTRLLEMITEAYKK